jgi:hypothetical protein
MPGHLLNDKYLAAVLNLIVTADIMHREKEKNGKIKYSPLN